MSTKKMTKRKVVKKASKKPAKKSTSKKSKQKVDNKPITERVQSYEDACKIKGIHPVKSLPIVKGVPKELRKTIIAGTKLMIIHGVLNEGEVMDPSNHDKWRYSPWVSIVRDKSKPSGFAFSIAHYGTWSTGTIVAARLLLRKSELALYSLKQFEELHIDYLVG